jgi:Flp pilus assembly protein TadB
MTLILKAFGIVTALILLVVAMLGHLIALGGFLLVALKVVILTIFLALIVLMVFSILRDRSRRRREAEDM